VQAVLWSDLPRGMVVSSLAETTGLKVEIAELHTGWSGRTRINDLALRLPGEDRPFAQVASAKLDHTGLIGLALGGGFELAGIEADGVKLHARADERGRWNLARIAGLVGAGGAPSEGGDSSAAGTPSIAAPSIDVSGLQVTVSDVAGRRAALTDVQLQATPAARSTLRWKLTSAQRVQATGTLDTRGNWSHTMTIEVPDAHAVGGGWLVGVVRPLRAELRWTGHISGAGLVGDAAIAEARVGEYTADGNASVTLAGGAVTVEPAGLHVSTPFDAVGRVTLTAGALSYRGSRIEAERVVVDHRALTMGVVGWYDIADASARLDLDWTGADGDAAGAATDRPRRLWGRLRGRLTTSTSGMRRLDLRASGAGRAAGVQWSNVAAHVDAQGPAWRDLDWSMRLLDGNASVRGRRVELAGLQAEGRVRGSRLSLDELRHDGWRAALEAGGWYDTATQQWNAQGALNHLHLPGSGSAVAVELRAAGDANRVQLTRATIEGSRWHLAADGNITLEPAAGWPVRLALTGAVTLDRGERSAERSGLAVDELDPNVGRLVRHVVRAEAPDASVAARWSGRATADADLTGTLAPMNLRLTGRVDTHGLRVRRQAIDDVTINLDGTVDRDHATVTTERFALLDGNATFEAGYDFGAQAARGTTDLTSVALARVAPMIDPNLAMRGEASAELDVRVPIEDPAKLVVRGQVSARDVRWNAVALDSAHGRLRTLDRGVILLDELALRHDAGRATGRMVLRLVGGLAARAQLALDDWPLAIEPYRTTARLDGDAQAELDHRGAVGGDFNVHADVELAGHHLAELPITGSWDPNRVDVAWSEANLLGGTTSGRAKVNLDAWWRSEGRLDFTGVEPAQLSPWWADANDLAGAMHVSLSLAPAKDRRAMEPLRVEVNMTPDDRAPLSWRSVPLGSLGAVGYAGRERLVLDESSWQVAGGEVSIWAMARRRPDHWHDHLQVKLRDVDLNPWVKALSDGEKPVPGRLNGRVNLYGTTGDWSGHDGAGRMRLTRSDLAGTDIIGRVFNLMGVDKSESRGAGLADFRLQGRRLDIDRFIYVNGATEILLYGRVSDLGRGISSPIRGGAIGTIRPFRKSEVEALNDFGRLLRAFQGGATTVRMRGTLAEPIIEAATLANVQARLNRLLTGE